MFPRLQASTSQPSGSAPQQQQMTPPQQLNLALQQQQQVAAAAAGGFAPMRSMFNSWPLPGAFGGMQNLMGMPGSGTAQSAPGGGGSGNVTPAWAGNAQGAPTFFNPFSQNNQQLQQLAQPPGAQQPQQQPVQQRPATADGTTPSSGIAAGKFGPAAVAGWGAPQPQAAAAELQSVLRRYAQAADGMPQQQERQLPPQQQQPVQQQPVQEPAQAFPAPMQPQPQFLQRLPLQGGQFQALHQAQGLNAASGGSEFSHASDPLAPMADGHPGTALLPPTDPLQQQQQALAAHSQLQQQTSGAAVAGGEFATVNFAFGGGDTAYQSPFLMAAAPAQADVQMAGDTAMPPTSDAGAIHVSVSPCITCARAAVLQNRLFVMCCIE